jgi:acyl-coenzyme A synthetase/AMP-(fatty) acid ligase
MGDVGYFDPQGRLWFCGRKGHRVQRKDGTTMYTVPCEAIFNEHEAVYRSALVQVDDEPVIIVELEPGVSVDRSQLISELLSFAEGNSLTSSIKIIRFHPGFPVDVRHNAKIHRGALAEWAKT